MAIADGGRLRNRCGTERSGRLRSEAGISLMLRLQTGHYEDEKGRNESTVFSNSSTFTGFVM